MDQNTLNYYDENADQFVESTRSVDFSGTQDRFLARLDAGAYILDFGCGSGRDTRYFLEKGYRVDATDGSGEMCRLASQFFSRNSLKQYTFLQNGIIHGHLLFCTRPFLLILIIP